MRTKWVKRRLGDCGEIISGGTPSTNNPVYWGGVIPFVTPLDLSRNDGAWLVSTIRSITEDGLANSSANLLQNNTLVISTRAPIGYLALTSVPSVTNQGCKSLSLNDTGDALYFYYHLHALVHDMECYGVGTTFSEISKRDLAKLKIVHPSSIDEQRRIAGILSTCDEVITRSRAAVEKLRKIKAGMLNDFFTRGIDDDGRLRPPPQQAPKLYKESPLGPIPKEWEVKRLGDVGCFKNGVSKGGEAFGHGVPFVNLLDVFGRDILTASDVLSLGLVEVSPSEVDVYSLKSGDVLFVRSSVKPSGVGLTTVVIEDLHNTVFSGFLLRFRGGGLNPNFARYVFRTSMFRARVIARSTVSANTNINQENLNKVQVAFPVDLSEQDRIALRLSAIDERIATEERVVAKYRSVKAGLMQRLLSPPGDAEVVDETILEAV